MQSNSWVWSSYLNDAFSCFMSLPVVKPVLLENPENKKILEGRHICLFVPVFGLRQG